MPSTTAGSRLRHTQKHIAERKHTIMNIKIQQIGTGKILTYAKEELTHFLKQYSPYQIVDSYTAAYEILLAYVPSPEAEYEYKISSRTTDTAK